jgi:hypothetical protein
MGVLENDINGSVLVDLDASMMQDMGLAPMKQTQLTQVSNNRRHLSMILTLLLALVLLLLL